MFLEQLILTNFKNYEKEVIDISSTITCFTGDNGMGKTNCLDAIYFLCMGRSHFSIPDKGLIRDEEEFFRVEGRFKEENDTIKVVGKLARRKKKVLEYNDNPIGKLSEHVGRLPIVMIEPNDSDLVRDGSAERRKFLDNTLSQIDSTYLQQLLLYNKVMQQRNAALKQMAENRRGIDFTLLSIYNKQLIGPAEFIHNARQQFMERFIDYFQQVYTQLSGNNETVSCAYQSQLHQSDMATLLDESQNKDAILQRTTTGIHKDDLQFVIDDRPLKKFGSQGQIKSFILALKLAQYQMLKVEKKCSPILLLDDIFAKLDASRVSNLLEYLLAANFGQIIVTDTHENRITKILTNLTQDFASFHIKNDKNNWQNRIQPFVKQ